MKKYISANDYLHDSWRLAEKIFQSGWRPDLIVVLWRGGAPVGVAVHEYLKARGWNIEHEVIKCSSYTGIGERDDKVEVDGKGGGVDGRRKVLFVDDVFDTGKTWETILTSTSLPQPLISTFRLATVYWKKPCNLTNLKPDYVVHEVGDEWLVFPHELDGLNAEEISFKDPFLKEMLNML